MVDPLAEDYASVSSYNYTLNNPIIFIDPDGAFVDYYDNNGNYIGTDGNDEDKRNFIVSDKKEAKAIKKKNKGGGTTATDDIKSKNLLPSIAVLEESLDVLKRTEDNGGLREESSIVMRDGNVIREATGELPVIKDGVQTAQTKIPQLPDGSTDDNVEAMIHSHPTKTDLVDGVAFPQTASEPTFPQDVNAFSRFQTNIIVGRLGKLSSYNSSSGDNRPLGAAIFVKGNSSKLELTRSAMNKIIKREKK